MSVCWRLRLCHAGDTEYNLRMERLWRIPRQWLILVVMAALMIAVGAIVWTAREPYEPPAFVSADAIVDDLPNNTARPVNVVGTPTPNPTPDGWNLDEVGVQAVHTVAAGETLGIIAGQYGVTADAIARANNMFDPNRLEIGEVLDIPVESDLLVGPSVKILPDSELVYGPALRGFDVRSFVQPFNSYLLRYQEEVEGRVLTGVDIVQLVADRLSISPRLLLAALEYSAGWVTQATPQDDGFPMRNLDPEREGLYRQLVWAGNQMNFGFYGRADGGLTSLTLFDGTTVLFAPEINDGTAGVQNWLGALTDTTYEVWQAAVAPDGFFATYEDLFGRSPFANAVEPLLPANLEQPEFTLPWAEGEQWFFSGGPHGGWASGSGWAALDFAPDDGEARGCYESEKWVRAVAPGTVTRSDFGSVVVDLDFDDYAGTGWAVLYHHLATQDRVPVGTRVRAGDPLGHPSCEGGVSTGTHLHLARTYNGRWISADRDLPFNLDGWVSAGAGDEYDGALEKDGVLKQACGICRDETNSIVAGNE